MNAQLVPVCLVTNGAFRHSSVTDSHTWRVRFALFYFLPRMSSEGFPFKFLCQRLSSDLPLAYSLPRFAQRRLNSRA